MDPDRFIRHAQSAQYYRGQVCNMQRLPAREAQFAELEPPPPAPLAEMLAAQGIWRLYTHQVSAVEAVRRGENVVVVTGTASGKTLCYNIPVLEGLIADPQMRALYLFPTKALAQDQLRGLLRFGEGIGSGCGTYDGDTAADQRRRLRDEASVILTNPDMLHSGILPNHSRWAHFFARLRYVIIDELHAYRGIFGSNLGNVLRRLRRVCAHYGAHPQFICCSATIGNPKQHAETLIAAPVTQVDNDGSPRGPKSFLIWNPPVVGDDRSLRRSPVHEAANLMTDLIAEFNVQTIAFVVARTSAELLYRYVDEQLRRRSHRLQGVVKPYRGGYLPERRREIEKALFEGRLMGVTSTNALELGIDIGGLDAALLVGYPGSIASTWQQAGRAGRGSEPSLAVLITRELPVDQYLAHHPDYLFGGCPEAAVCDPGNPFVLYRHIRCALQELPMSGADAALFGENTGGVLGIIADLNEAVERRGRWYWNGRGTPSLDVSLRNSSNENFLIQEVTANNAVIGEMDKVGAYTQLHEQAIYIQNGETHFVERLDLNERVAYVRKGNYDYFTMAITDTQLRLLREPDDPPLETDWRGQQLGFGPAEVLDTVYMFRKIKFGSNESIGFGKVDLPGIELDTLTMWLAPSAEVRARVLSFGRKPSEGMLGIANAVVGVLPLWVMCDRGDVGTVVDSSNLGVPAMFIYDRFPGGLGFARRAFDRCEELLRAALAVIEDCPCEDGCPSCAGARLLRPDPQAEAEAMPSGMRLPDKEAALCMLRDMLGLELYTPRLPPGYSAATETETSPSGRTTVAPQLDKLTEGRPPAPLELAPLPEHIERRIRQQIANDRDRRMPR